jgi:hypothetical protein
MSAEIARLSLAKTVICVGAKRLRLPSVRCIFAEAEMCSGAVIEVDNPTPMVMSHEKSVIRGTRGLVVLSLCTRCSLSKGIPSVDAVAASTIA